MSKSANSPSPGRARRVALETWAPLGMLTLSALALQGGMPPWGKMWTLAAAIYAGFKWATWWRARDQRIKATPARSAAYLLLWPGMDARAFLDLKKKPAPPTPGQWLWACGKVGIGTVLIWECARLFDNEWLAGWTGMVGLMFLLHFGLLEMLAFFWQSRGVQAQPLMNAPFRSTSLGEFWGRRWNSGFRIIAFDLMFQPLRRWMSVSAAMMGTFFLSGLIHDLVISVPISGGYGFPMLYFLIQGAGMLIERSAMGRRPLGRNGWRTRTFTLVTLIAPGGWLFPPLFVEKVMVPFLQAIQALQMKTSTYIQVAGSLQIVIILANFLLPRILDYRGNLTKLPPIIRHIFWAHSAYIVLVLAGFAAISLIYTEELCGASGLGRFLSGFLAIFWLSRVAVQIFVYDAEVKRAHPWGNAFFTLAFLYLGLAYLATALTAL